MDINQTNMRKQAVLLLNSNQDHQVSKETKVRGGFLQSTFEKISSLFSKTVSTFRWFVSKSYDKVQATKIQAILNKLLVVKSRPRSNFFGV